MSRQTTLGPQDHREQPAAPPSEVRGGIADLLHDMMELAELQIRLLLADGRQAWPGSRLSLLGILAGVVLALGSMPVLLAGVALGISAASGLSTGAGLALTGALLGVVPAGALVWLCLGRLRKSVGTLSRSAEELSTNIACFKAALKRSTDQARPERKSS